MSQAKKWYQSILDKLLDKYRQLDADVNGEEVIKQVSTRKTKEFVGIIFRELGELLDEQVYEKKNGEIICPPKVKVFLSRIDDKEWRGAKRQALKEDLESICLEKVKELTVKTLPSNVFIEIDLKVDEQLGAGEIRAEHQWEDVDSKEETTKLLPLGKNDEDKEKTIPFNNISSKAFFIEVWHGGEYQQKWEFFQNEVVIGRNSERKGKVDLHLANDPRIARIHAILEIDDAGNFWITVKGDNETKVGNDIILPNRTVKVEENQEIKIIDFALKLRK